MALSSTQWLHLANPTQDTVLNALRAVATPSGGDVVSAGMVSDILIQNGRVIFALAVPHAEARRFEPVRQAAEIAVKRLAGVSGVTVALTAEAKAPPQAPAPGTRAPLKGVADVSYIVGVASGKGGVGKSTVAANVAVALAQAGRMVGLLDADIYGPSVPRLVGRREKPEVIDGNTIRPITAHGLKVMSMGFLVDEGQAMVWRGPMVQSAIVQQLRDVAWGRLDVLVVDMPPGTGDVQLTLAQSVPMAGAMIVSTPQDLALIDARKAIAMFGKVGVPILGVVENMSTFICPRCGERSDIFGHGGAAAEARAIGAPFLGEIPLSLAVRETSDAGQPIVAAQPESPQAAAFRAIANALWTRLEGGTPRRAPRIIME